MNHYSFHELYEQTKKRFLLKTTIQLMDNFYGTFLVILELHNISSHSLSYIEQSVFIYFLITGYLKKYYFNGPL